MSTESKSSPFGIDPSAFGPFGAVFNAYSNYVRNFGAQDFNGFGALARGPEAAIEQRHREQRRTLARAQLEVDGLGRPPRPSVYASPDAARSLPHAARCRRRADGLLAHGDGALHRQLAPLDGSLDQRGARPCARWAAVAAEPPASSASVTTSASAAPLVARPMASTSQPPRLAELGE